MKNGGTLAEIETALSLAQKLAQQHGIDINSIDENEPAKEQITQDHIKLSRLQIECKYALLICKNFFYVDFVLSVGYGIHFIGTPTNIAIAKYVYHFLVKRFRWEWNNNRGRLRNRQAFMDGMFQALANKLHYQMQKPSEREGLVLSNQKDQLKKYIKQSFGKTQTTKVKPDNHAATAFRHGLYAGKNININPAVESNITSTKLLE